MKKKYKVIDLFSGAGGLSLGFIQSGRFDIKVAFENNPAMQETYKNNHPKVDVRGDVSKANYSEIQSEFGKIDVVIGGPPCQGFSNANRQKKHAISQNNMLVKQYIRAICELQPIAFVMENVSMLRSEVHRFYLDRSDEHLLKKKKITIPMTPTRLVLLDKSYMFDDALSIVQSYDSIVENIWPEEIYSVMNVIYKATKNSVKLIAALAKHQKAIYEGCSRCKCSNQYISEQTQQAFNAVKGFFDGEIPASSIKNAIEPSIMIQRMLSKALEVFQNNIVIERYGADDGVYAVIQSYAVFDYLVAILGATPYNYSINADVLCAADFGAPQKRNRFVIIGIKDKDKLGVRLPEKKFDQKNYRTVHDAISDLESVRTVKDIMDDKGVKLKPRKRLSELARELRDCEVLYNQIITNSRENALQRFHALKQGDNFHSLDESLKNNTYTDVSRTQNTIYLRLDYNLPCGTVVNVRKSMWVHPVIDRAISVREAARLQTFPDSFIFYGSKDKQYQQVGNAVPPIMARAIAECLVEQLDRRMDRFNE